MRSLVSNRAISLVFVIALVLRIRLAAIPRLDADEMNYVIAATKYFGGDWTANWVHPMVGKLLFAGSMALSYIILPSRPDAYFYVHYEYVNILDLAAARLVNVALGSLTCVFVYLIAKGLFNSNKRAALLAAFTLVFDPLSIGEDSLALLDPPMVFFITLSVLLVERYIVKRQSLAMTFAAVSFGLAVATKFQAAAIIVLLMSVVLWRQRSRLRLRSIFLFFLISITVFFASQPYLWTQTSGKMMELADYYQKASRVTWRVRMPGHPFVLPESRSEAMTNSPGMGDVTVPVPWWYPIYILLGYSTPFQVGIYLVYPALIVLYSLKNAQRTVNLRALWYLVFPIMYLLLLTAKSHNYVILASVFNSLMVAQIAYLSKGRTWRIIIGAFLILHVTPSIYAVVAASKIPAWTYVEILLSQKPANLAQLAYQSHASAWTYYPNENPILLAIESFFQWLYLSGIR